MANQKKGAEPGENIKWRIAIDPMDLELQDDAECLRDEEVGIMDNEIHSMLQQLKAAHAKIQPPVFVP